MGQKVHPRGFRLGIIEDWDSTWYSKKDYAVNVKEDLKLRKYLKSNLYRAGVSKIKIKRRANQIEIDVYSAKPGLIIGRGGREVAAVRDNLIKMTGKQIQLNIQEEGNPETSAQLVAENIAYQLEKRVAYRRAMRQTVTKALRSGAKGIKVKCGGRLGGAEIARKEWYRRGRVPLHTLRARIDYGFTEAMTVYGKIGVKVWIYKGEVLDKKE
ncbi:30S ribosomal protein S3, partial [Candidatus Margulisiibacteriota bacterium]